MVTFKNKKLLEVKQRWPMHEMERFAVVHCLKLWPHHLSSHNTIVYTNNVS